MTEHAAGRVYGAYYDAHGCGRRYQHDGAWLNLFYGIAERIARDISLQRRMWP